MQKNINSNERGFTIIEVVLVLAIAGLIFLMVFLALPALQRSQRDTQRKNSVSRLMSQLVNYESNNQGSLPPATAAGWTGAAAGLIPNYMTNNGQTFTDPSTNATYTVTLQAGLAAAPTNLGVLNVYYNTPAAPAGARCTAGTPSTPSASAPAAAGQIAVVIALETGGWYCVQN